MDNLKICASCGCTIDEPDCSAVCPDCGRTYHRRCFEDTERGICLCERSVETPSAHSPTSGAACPVCGEYSAEGASFCQFCDAALCSGSSTEALLTGENTRYYLSRFADMRKIGGIFSWNWGAFLFTPFWCFYRKMYAEGIISMLIQIIARAVGGSLLQLIVYIAYALLGNFVYMQHIERLAQRADSLTGDERAEFVRKKGGVSTSAAVLFGAAYLTGIFIYVIVALNAFTYLT